MIYKKNKLNNKIYIMTITNNNEHKQIFNKAY